MKAQLGDLDHLPLLEQMLLEAVDRRDLAAVLQLLAAGADVGAADIQGLTALHVAADAAQPLIVAVLLAAGASITAKTGGGEVLRSDMTPLQYMTEQMGVAEGRWHTVLHPKGGLIHPPHLCSARCLQAAQVVQQLVAAGAIVQEPVEDDDGQTPLHYATEAGCSAVMASLLMAGADLGSTTPSGYTMLHAAAKSGSLGVVQWVLGTLGPSRAAELVRALGADCAWDCIPRSTPLHLAAAGGHLEVVEALVAAGADLEQLDSRGYTALEVALQDNQCHMVSLLTTPGIVNRECHGRPLLQAAALPRRDWLTDEVQWRQPRAAAAATAVATLLAAGADASAKNQQGCTALAVAAAEGQPEVLQVLLRHELQQRQQAAGSAQLLPAMLEEVAAQAVRAGNGGTLRLLLTLAADAQGEAGVRSLWGGLKKRLLQLDQPIAEGERFKGSKDDAATRAFWAQRGWVECWAATCKDLAAQRCSITGRLEQLVIPSNHYHHHHQQQQQQQQQQQGAGSAEGPTSKRPRLARELRRLKEQLDAHMFASAPQALTAAAGPALPYHTRSTRSNNSSSVRAAGAEACPHTSGNSAPAPAVLMAQLTAAAARGDAPEVLASLGQLPDRPEGLKAGAIAAGAAGHWGLCLELLRELMMMEEDKRKAAHAQTVPYAVSQAYRGTDAQHRRQEQQQVDGEQEVKPGVLQKHMWELEAALGACDALLIDWLALRQQQVRELRAAVVAAVVTGSSRVV